MKKKVLITGATGFVGSHILEQMIDHPQLEAVAACRDSSRLIPAFNGETRQGDLLDAEYRQELLRDIDIVCHAAAWTSLWGHKRESDQLYLAPTLALIEQSIEAGVKRFINVSTTSASPAQSSNPLSAGIKTSFWPHLDNVIEIENVMREHADDGCQMINLRLGIFAGDRYSLGLLPILLPRLKTHLVPWVNKGSTAMPIIDGKDIGQAFVKTCAADQLENYDAFNIIGPEVPTARQVIKFIHQHYSYPQPHFSVPFSIAYPFALLMEKVDLFVPWEPLVTRSIIHLLEDTDADNKKASEILNYQPRVHWQDSVKKQIDTLLLKNEAPMKMVKDIQAIK